MKLLLDTHIWIWSLAAPARLGSRVRRALRSSRNELWLSPMSVWEAMILAENRRLSLGMEVREWVEEAQRRAPMMEAPVTREIAMESRRIALPHQDPVDRFLAATAKVLDLMLVTSDNRLLSSSEFSTLSNRES
jgi:PIN domain nuclease of toxin-antitoxin system